MDEVVYLTFEDFLAAACAALRANSSTVERMTSRQLAESALNAPAAQFGGVESYPDFAAKVAVLLQRVATNHALPDGNKRTALLCAIAFANLNGWAWQPPTADDPDGDETATVVEAAAANAVSVEELMPWIAERLVPISLGVLRLPEGAEQVEVVGAAFDFLALFYEDGDLSAAWPLLDPVLRLCWVQWWAHANGPAMTAAGLDSIQLADDLAAAGDGHPLWEPFARVILRDVRGSFQLDPSTWGIGATPRMLSIDTEVLYVHRRVPPGGVWPPGAVAEVVPLVMRLGQDQQWRVLNLGYECIPQPGWPPVFDGTGMGGEA